MLPPLRERAERHSGAGGALRRAGLPSRTAGSRSRFEPDAIQELQRYSWPGNVRELRNVVERLLLLADGPVDVATVRLALPPRRAGAGGGGTPSAGPLAERTDAFEREEILAELKRHRPAHDGYGQGAGSGAQPPVQEVPGVGHRSAGDAKRGVGAGAASESNAFHRRCSEKRKPRRRNPWVTDTPQWRAGSSARAAREPDAG